MQNSQHDSFIEFTAGFTQGRFYSRILLGQSVQQDSLRADLSAYFRAGVKAGFAARLRAEFKASFT